MSEFQIRSYREQDLPNLVRLINEADRVDRAGYATTEAALAHRLARPERPPRDAVCLAEQGGKLVGWAMLWRRREERLDRVIVEGVVSPDDRRRGIGTALMRRVEERARALREDKPAFLEMQARERMKGAAELALSIGMQPVRYFFYMQCHELERLPAPTLPGSLRLRNYVPGQDEEPFVAAYNDAFSDHWGYVLETLEHERHRVNGPEFRAEDNLLACDADGRIVGLCIVLVPEMDSDLLRDNPPLIDDLAVTHAYRRHGLGRALLLAGLERIRELGFSAAALGVDADNPNRALHLYESVGFQIVSRATAFRKELAQ